MYNKWGKVFKNWPSKICERQPLKNLKWHGLPKQTISLQIFKDCLPQILLGLFSNTLPQIFQVHVKFLSTISFDFIKNQMKRSKFVSDVGKILLLVV